MRLPRRHLAPSLALLVTVLVSAMDITVVSTVLPTIVGELGGLALYSWSFSAYLLTSTTTLPLYGKLADVYGRKPLFFWAMALFLLGSLLCGLATSMELLIAYRAVQGLGAGGLMTLTITLAGDLFPADERPKIQAAISAVWGLAAIVGPGVGIAIVAYTSWRWVFWLNLPVGLVASAILARSLHERVTPRRHHVDYAGAALLTAGVGALLAALVEGGQGGFASPMVLALLGASALLLGLLAWVEARAPEPVVPLTLLRGRLQGLASLAAFVLGACVYSVSTYLPLFVQGTQGGTPFEVGVVTGAMSLSWTGGSLAAGRTVRWLSFRATALAGMAVLVASGVLLARMTVDTAFSTVVVASLVAGLGMGLCSTPLIVMVQNAVDWEQRGVATAAQQFFRSIGGTLWVSLQGTVLAATVGSALAAAGVALPGGGGGAARQVRLGELNAMLDPATRATLPPEQVRVLADVLADGLQPVFLLYLAATVAGLVVIALLPHDRLSAKEAGGDAGVGEVPAGAAGGERGAGVTGPAPPGPSS
jgi:EmrB/QacA subfamily drug resistance transporter